MVTAVKDTYKDDITRFLEKKLKKEIKSKTDRIVDQEYNQYKIEANMLESKR